MVDKDIRWKQRFQNFEKAFVLLEKALDKDSLNEIERGGLIQFFEMAFELSWKTLKDFLEYEGIRTKGARDTIKMSFKLDLIRDGHTWIEALEDRNLTVHIYDESLNKNLEYFLKNKYFTILKDFHERFKSEL